LDEEDFSRTVFEWPLPCFLEEDVDADDAEESDEAEETAEKEAMPPEDGDEKSVEDEGEAAEIDDEEGEERGEPACNAGAPPPELVVPVGS